MRRNKSRKKTLYLHIGHFKTGTSALQVFFEQNLAFLAKHGVEYVEHRRWFCKHSYLAFAIYESLGVTRLMHGYPFKDSPQDVWSAFFDAVRASPHQRLLASTEELMRVGGHPGAQQVLSEVAALGRDIDIRIVAYLRQPRAHLASWYNQLIKMGGTVPDFDTAVRGIMEEVHFDYAQALAPWAEVFGDEALIVRPYFEGVQGSDALFADFLSVLDIELPVNGLCYPESDPNPRMPADEVRLTRLIYSAGLPMDVAKRTGERIGTFLDLQEKAQIRPLLTREEVAERITAGLAFLRGLPGNDVDVDSFLANETLEGGDPVLRETQQLAGFLLAELQILRRRVSRENNAMRQRIEALEAAIARDKK